MLPTNDLAALAGTIAGEIRGGTLEQKQNVAQVILNRFHSGSYKSIRDVCLAHEQFSCWNVDDPNSSEIVKLDVTEPEVWASCMEVARVALGGGNPDRVNGAKNYFATSSKTPWWMVEPYTITLQDGAHTYVRFP